MSRSTLAVAALLFALLGVVRVLAQASEADNCTALAAVVTANCPRSCTTQHCQTRCIPPFADDGRCGFCQENCAEICAKISAQRGAKCAEVPPTDDGPAASAAAGN